MDSAHIVIRVTDCGAAHLPIGWSVDPVPDLELGQGTDEQFNEIRGVVAMPGGGVVVMDYGSRGLRYFDSEGDLLVRAGGPGAGPGEFKYPFMVHTPTSDSVMIFDTGTRRFTSYSSDGTGKPHTLPSASWLRPGPAPIGLVGDHLLLKREGWIPVKEAGLHEQDVTFVWVEVSTGEETALRRFYVNSKFVVIERSSGLNYIYDVPFGSYPSAVATRTGAMLTSGADFDIFDFDTNGRLRQILRIKRRRRPVGRGDFEDYRDLAIRAGRGTEESWQLFSDMPLPDSMRAFTSLQIDELGWLWAEMFQWDYNKPTSWFVFDPEGRARGTVELPPGLDVHEIGREYVLGTWTDEFGVEYLRRHTLQRGMMPDIDP